MERWAANTLRVVGIVFTAIIVICGCLLLVLLGQCAAGGGYGGGRNPDAGAGYFLGAGLLGIGGITFIATLARGIHRSRLAPQTVAPAPETDVTSAISTEGQRAIDRVFWCLAAQLALVGLECIYSWLQYERTGPQMPAYYSRLFLVDSILYAIPYAVLLGFVRQRVNRSVLTFAFGIPAAAILQTLITILPLTRFYLRSSYSMGAIMLPLVLDVVLVVLAYQAAERSTLQSPASSQLTATAVAFLYFYVLHLVLPFIYRLVLRP